jgi:uncharacterized protein (TIGR03118 family)
VLTDPALVNPWGVSRSGSSPFWVSDNGTGKTTLYAVDPTSGTPSKLMLEVTIPGAGSVTGQAFANVASAFNGDAFLFVSEDGTVSGWRGALGTTSEVLALSSSANVYKGTAFSDQSGNTYLYAANFRSGAIDVFKGNAGAPDLTGRFTDPALPSGYAPFNIENLGGLLYVSYALQDANKHDDVAGAGHGFVDVFDLQGASSSDSDRGEPNLALGPALAPNSFAALAGICSSETSATEAIHAYDPSTGALRAP